MLRLPETRDEIIANIETYVSIIENIGKLSGRVKETMLQTVSRTQGWVVAYNNGRWVAGPIKFCGAGADMTPELYEKHRKGKLDPNVASASMAEIFFKGDTSWEGSEITAKSHPAPVKAVFAMAKAVDKALRDGTRFYMLRGEGINDADRATVEQLFGIIEKANLPDNALEALVMRIEA